MDFKGVKAISFHGPGECGGDFNPFYKIREFGKIVYYSAQAKAVKIHSKAGKKSGSVNELIDQMKKLFRTPFTSFIDNTEKKIAHAFIFCSNDFSPEAKKQLFLEFDNKQSISLIDIDDLISVILDKDLVETVLNFCRKKNIASITSL